MEGGLRSRFSNRTSVGLLRRREADQGPTLQQGAVKQGLGEMMTSECGTGPENWDYYSGESGSLTSVFVDSGRNASGEPKRVKRELDRGQTIDGCNPNPRILMV